MTKKSITPLLCIDCGNTRLKWGLANSPKAFSVTNWVTHQDSKALQRLIANWRALVLAASPAVWISNVAGLSGQQLITTALRDAFGNNIRIHWVNAAASGGGIRNLYQNPTQLGSDRYAALIGAQALFPDRALIVINCGTALTIDHLTADGQFLGGMIAPGLRLMTDSLTRNAAQLPDSFVRLQSTFSHTTFPRNSNDAILNGCIAAQIGAIQMAYNDFQQHSPMLVISGGDAVFMESILKKQMADNAIVVVDHLVLLGLQTLALLDTEQASA